MKFDEQVYDIVKHLFRLSTNGTVGSHDSLYEFIRAVHFLSDSGTPYITVDTIVSRFLNQFLSLLFGADEEEEGKINIKTSRGAHLTSELVLDALQRG